MKKIIIALVALTTVFAIAQSAFAEEVTPSKHKFNYGTGKLTYDDTSTLDGGEQELTILLVQADANGEMPATITGDSIYYVDQESGTSFGVFESLGVKGGANIPAGKYFLVVGGSNVESSKQETIIIGESNETKLPTGLFDATTKAIKYHEVKKETHDYTSSAGGSYTAVSTFNLDGAESQGWIFQYTNNGKTYTYCQPISINDTISGQSGVSLCVKVNNLKPAKDESGNDVPIKNFTVIPYTITNKQ